MLVTLDDIAKKTGFSVSTVSRVLHDEIKKYRISDDTQTIIKNAAVELGYRPNRLARGLRLQQTHEIGVVVPDIANPFFSALIKSIASELHKMGYYFVVYDSDENIMNERAAIRSLLEKRVDGLIVAAVGQDFSHLDSLHDAEIPLVMVDRGFNALDVDSVSVDNVKGALLAVDHLIREGHTRIAFIQGLPGTYANETRLQGYRQALSDAAIPIDDGLIVGDDFRSLNGYLETNHLMKLSDPPTAIFAAGDLIALGALEACREQGVKIPDDLSLVTFDDPVFTSYLSPALTAVEQPIIKMAEMAVALLFHRIRNPKDEPRKILLEPKLNIRASVARISSDLRSTSSKDNVSVHRERTPT
jgi:LacI family transcriptional regulator